MAVGAKARAHYVGEFSRDVGIDRVERVLTRAANKVGNA
jgi:hypothetical protein